VSGKAKYPNMWNLPTGHPRVADNRVRPASKGFPSTGTIPGWKDHHRTAGHRPSLTLTDPVERPLALAQVATGSAGTALARLRQPPPCFLLSFLHEWIFHIREDGSGQWSVDNQ
jgi:hypothetical protein